MLSSSVSLPNPSVLSRSGQDRTCHLLVGFRQDLICVWRLFCKPLWSLATRETLGNILGEKRLLCILCGSSSLLQNTRAAPRSRSAELTELKMTVHQKSWPCALFFRKVWSKHKAWCLWGTQGPMNTILPEYRIVCAAGQTHSFVQRDKFPFGLRPGTSLWLLRPHSCHRTRPLAWRWRTHNKERKKIKILW